MVDEQTRNLFIVVGGGVGFCMVLVGGFVLLCALSWALLWGMNWAFAELGYARPFGGENGPVGLEILIGAFLLLSLRRLTRINRPED